MNEKMRMCLYEAQTADGKTARIISRFEEKTEDPEATKAAVMPLLEKTPEHARLQNVKARLQAQAKTAQEEYALANEARKGGDKKSETLHAKAYNLAAACVEDTQAEIAPLADELSAAFTRLYDENKQYCDCGPHQCCCGGRYEALQAKYDALKEHERLDSEGRVWDDWRGVEYHFKENGKWKKDKIEFLGQKPPKGFVLQENITPEIQFEISAQQEAERLAAMTPEEKAKWKQNALDALADEADRLDRRNKIQRKTFDAQKYYDEGAAEIEKKYA